MTHRSSPLLIPVLSHLTTGIILSPLDLVRTRLIAQSSMHQYRTYSGPIDCLSSIIRHEGGLSGIYFHPHLLLPTVLENMLRHLITLSLPSFFGNLLGVSDDIQPIAWSVVEFFSGCASLLITIPVETVRRRLQIQVRGSIAPVVTCVNTRSKPYNGVFDVFRSIITEEASTPAHQHNRDRWRGKHHVIDDKKRGARRLSQLYRGFTMGVGAGAIVMTLSIMGGGRQSNGGWAEL